MVVFICACGLYYGYITKDREQENRYYRYIETHDINDLNPEILSYDAAIYDEFVRSFLGNSPSQLLMGGYFYKDEKYSIYPSQNGNCTMICCEGMENVLFNKLVDNINVRNDVVYFRDPSHREIMTYEIGIGYTEKLNLQHVGQFVICGDYYYYVNLNDSRLIRYNKMNEKSEVVADSVVSFTVAGNSVLYLDKTGEIHAYNMVLRSDESIASNVISYAYDGNLLFQKNRNLYLENLYGKTITELDLSLNCNRLLGVTKTHLFFETDDGIYMKMFSSDTVSKVTEQVFVGGSEERILLYDIENDTYSSSLIYEADKIVNDSETDILVNIQPSDERDHITAEDEIMAELNDNNVSSSISIPAKLVYKETKQTDYDLIAKESSIESIELKSDGSLTVNAFQDIPLSADEIAEKLLQDIESRIEQHLLPHFVSVSADEQLTSFQIVINAVSLNAEEKRTVAYIFFMSGLHSILDNNNTDIITIDFMSMNGSILKHMDSSS